MSADAATLLCPVCLHSNAFNSVQSLRDRLIYVSTQKLLCPVCQEEICGLDKLTIHLFSHVKLICNKSIINQNDKTHVNDIITSKIAEKLSLDTSKARKCRPTTAKNKAATSTASTSMKFVKICPKPVIFPNTFPLIEIPPKPKEVVICPQKEKPIELPKENVEEPLCNVCGLYFANSNILKMHKCLIHNLDGEGNSNLTRYQCHLCPKNFKMRGSLMVHMRVAHYGFSISRNNMQEKDGKESPTNVKLIETNTEKCTDNKQWQCDVCKKCFTTKYFLKKHKRLHTGETPYACAQCNKTFTFQQSYHKHLLYHNDEKPHACNYCGRAFKELSTLHNHQRIHTGEKPFSCETCGKCFRQRVSYLVHRRIHTGAMPYKCTACHKSFRYKVSQRTHKCQAQPPGQVVRKSSDLVEKLKKKQPSDPREEPSRDCQNYPEVSEANAELARKGAKLSFEDTETENFTLITEAFCDNSEDKVLNHNCNTAKSSNSQSKGNGSLNSTVSNSSNGDINGDIDDLFTSMPMLDRSIPSPSEIFKNLCLSSEDIISTLQEL